MDRRVMTAWCVTALCAAWAVQSHGAAFQLSRLEGAWWSDSSSPTADFVIARGQVWLDFDASFHPCRLDGDILVFELAHGEVRNRIVSLDDGALVLENLDLESTTTYFREESSPN